MSIADELDAPLALDLADVAFFRKHGYVKLRQFGEGLDAAKKAVQLTPEDFLVWQNLGQLQAALQRPAEALSAFQRAAALNDRDVVSLVQEGLLNTQLGHLSDARIAFDKALAASSENAEALCGAASLAQKEGLTLLVIEHNMRVMMSLADRVTVMQHGTVIAEILATEARGVRRALSAAGATTRMPAKACGWPRATPRRAVPNLRPFVDLNNFTLQRGRCPY